MKNKMPKDNFRLLTSIFTILMVALAAAGFIFVLNGIMSFFPAFSPLWQIIIGIIIIFIAGIFGYGVLNGKK